MADKKITPKPAASKDKQAGDRAAARVSLKRTHKQTTQEDREEAQREEDTDLPHICAPGGGRFGPRPSRFGLACSAARR